MTRIHYKLPNLIIAGVHKAGTTSLYTYLGRHPQICQSYKKEIGYFSPLMFGGEIGSLEDYATHFSHCGSHRYRMEASPSYFYGKERVANAINEAMPEARIILILRNPTDRLVSFFKRAVSKSMLPEETDFSEYISLSERKLNSEEQSVQARGVREGIYINYLEPWQSIFGERLQVVFFDDLEESAAALTDRLLQWLGLDSNELTQTDFSVENKTRQYRYRGLHRQIKDWYMKSEGFWRRHHKLKQRLRSAYNAFNADSAKTLRSVDQAAIERLNAFYEPYNAQLRLNLEAYGHLAFPSWLQSSPSLPGSSD